MKKIKLLFILLSIFILSSCSINSDEELSNSNNIVAPKNKLEISGVWEKTYELDTVKNKKINSKEQIYISDRLLEFEEIFILDPNISSRYVNINNYLNTKVSKLPEEIKFATENVIVYKFSDNLTNSQEFIKISDNSLMTIYLGNIIVYEKKSELSAKQINEKYINIKSLTQDNKDVKDKNFGLAISFRARDTSVSTYSKYNYYTYYIKKSKKDLSPSIIKVNDIVLPKPSGIWTISQEVIEDDKNSITRYKLSANPTFISDKEKTNSIQDELYRRIDYVDRDFIAVTNFNYNLRNVSESYNIFNLYNLAKKESMSVTEIAGMSGNEIYRSTYKENANILFSENQIKTFEMNPNPNNIGMQRGQNNWKFVSGIDQELSVQSGSRLYKKFDLKITPIINIGRTANSKISWRDIVAKNSRAIDATISPKEDFVLVQTPDTLELYPIYYNFLGNKPLFAIQNVKNYEIVMIQWINDENLENYYEEYSKLPKINNYITYPN